jgi:hypothetical protein
MRANRHLLTLSACVAAALAVAALPAAGADRSIGGRSEAHAADEVARDLAIVRRATARFRDVKRAQAAGYRAAGPCVAVPGQGAMGVHYVNPALMADPAVRLRRPEALLYAPHKGRMKLVGVEYVRADEDGDVETDDDRPSVFGRGFDGPMAGHGPGEPVHYDLHVWAWRKNPRGTFAPFNPRVRC